ncbi:MAG: ABC transporter permease [Halobacteriales archaeon]|nr:ABC transporter permease [Halobacteriales archaeon]
MKLRYYVARRLGLTVIVLLGVTTITFVLTHVIPSNPAALWAGERATAEQIAQARQELGLNQPLYVQYLDYIFDIFRGELGTSLRTRQPVLKDLVTLFPATFELVLVSMLIATAVGIPLGVISAQYRNTLPDHFTRFFSLSGVSIPVFWLGMMLQILFFSSLGWLPLQGRVASDVVAAHPLDKITGLLLVDALIQLNIPVFISGLKHIILPAVSLSYASLAIITRMSRSSMLEVMQEEYMQVHKASGLPSRTIVYKFGLKNSLNSVLTVIGLSFGYLLGGTVLIESIFSWPGLGRYIVQSIFTADFPAVMGVTLVFATSYTLINLLVDVSYAWLNPRIRAEGGES